MDNLRLHGGGTLYGEDTPISFERQERRQFNDAYVNMQHSDFVGFGADTLADMHLTSLLLMEVSSYCNIQLRKLLYALPAPLITTNIAERCCERTHARLTRRHFRFFVNRMLYLIPFLLLSGDLDLNSGPLTTFGIELL